MEKKPNFHWAWVILAICFSNFFITYSIRLGYGILLPPMSESLSLTKTQGGLIYSFFFFAYLLFSPIVGNLTDRFGARKVMALFSIFLALGTMLMGRLSGFWSGAFSFGLTGLGASAIFSPIISLVQRWFGSRRRGIALGILQMGAALGVCLMGIFLPMVVSRFGWRFSWYLLGGSVFLIVFMNAFYLRNDPKELQLLPWGDGSAGVEQKVGQKKVSYREIFRLRPFWIIGVSYLFTSASFYVIFTFLVMYVVTEIGISHSIASGFMAVMAFAGLFGCPFLLYLSDHVGRRKAILLCHFSIFFAAIGILLSERSLPGLIVSVGALGFFFHPLWPLYGACSRDYFDQSLTGTIVGLWTIFYGVGGIIFPSLGGYLADLTETFIYSFAFAIGLIFLSSLFMILAKEEGSRGGLS